MDFIPGEDGCRVYFEKKALSGLNMHKLFIGSNVEYRVRYGPRIEAAEVSRGRPQHQDPLQFLSPGSTKRY